MSDCMRCPYNRTRRAKLTRFFTIGENPDQVLKLRLCEACTARFDRELHQWIMVAELIELPAPALRVTRAAGGSPVFGDESAKRLRELREKAQGAKPVATVTSEAVVDEVLIGPRADEWRFTVHAQKRAKQRNFTTAQVLKAAAYAETTMPCNDPDNPDAYYHVADDCCVVVNPKQKIIITTYEKFEYLLKSSEESKVDSPKRGVA